MTKSLALKTPGKARTSKEWLALSELYVDPHYQRPLDTRRVQRMVDAFDPDALGLPFVAEMPKRSGRGTFAIIDGQHRIVAETRGLAPSR